MTDDVQPRGTVTVYPPPRPGKKHGRTPPNAGKGRPKGVPNKINRTIREMVVEALEGAGGVNYLMVMAYADPKAFLALVGRVVPLQIGADPDGLPLIQKIERIIVQPQVTVRVVQPQKK